MRVDHVVVALVHRQVDRLADRAARVVEPRRDVRELHEVAEVLDRPVAAPAVEVAHERRPVGGREDRVLPAEDDVVRPVPRDLRELARARSPARAGGTGRAGTGRARRRRPRPRSREELERVGGVAEVDPDLLEDRVGVLLERREALLGEDLERRQRPREERHALDVRRAAAPPGAPPARRCAGLWSRSCDLLSEADPSPRSRPRRPLMLAAAALRGRDIRFVWRGAGRSSRGARTGRRRAGSPSRSRSAPGSAARRRSRPSRPERTTPSISSRAPRSRSAMRAPVAGGVPGGS